MKLDLDALDKFTDKNDVLAELRKPVKATPTARRVMRQGRGIPQPVTITFTVHGHHAPALRSAIMEISNEVGGRLEGMYRHSREHALTRAACALGVLRAAICKQVPTGDADYE